MKALKFLLPLLSVGLVGFPDTSQALTAQAEIDLGAEALMGVATRYILNQMLKPGETEEDVIRLANVNAGILKFVFRDDKFTDPDAMIEVVELEADRARLKVTLPADFGGRAELLANKLRQASAKIESGASGVSLPYDAHRVYRSALRFILKEFVKGKQKEADVVRIASENVGLIRFAYRKGSVADPEARVEVLPVGKTGARLFVALPSLSSDRQILLETQLLASVKADLGEPETAATEETP